MTYNMEEYDKRNLSCGVYEITKDIEVLTINHDTSIQEVEDFKAKHSNWIEACEGNVRLLVSKRPNVIENVISDCYYEDYIYYIPKKGVLIL